MARSAQPLRPWPGISAAALVAALIFGTLAAVALMADASKGVGPADWAALRFTLIQATLSALFSVVLAVPVARALARRRFYGRRILITLLGAPFILPVIVAIIGLLQVFGRSGWVTAVLEALSLPTLQIYGLHGVVLAHVFFNLPLATRLLLQGWQEIPAERFRLAAQLQCNGNNMFRLLEWPMLCRVVPGALAVVFAICLTSFAVALTLGGGPRATTLELAIYQAFTYDFDLGRAAILSGGQLVLTATAAALALRFSVSESFGNGLDRAIRRWDGEKLWPTVFDTFWIGMASLFLMLPLGTVLLSGLAGVSELTQPIFRSAAISISLALVSTVVLLFLAIPMAAAIATKHQRWVEVSGFLGLAASPLVLGTGLFVIVRPLMDPTSLALPVTALINAIMALPFALRILIPSARAAVESYGKLAMSLNMKDLNFYRIVLLPRMRPQIGFAAGLGAALSMGDLGVIALFANTDQATLPLQIYRLMGAYRMEAAASAALLLVVLSMGLFWILDRGGRRHVEA